MLINSSQKGRKGLYARKIGKSVPLVNVVVQLLQVGVPLVSDNLSMEGIARMRATLPEKVSNGQRSFGSKEKRSKRLQSDSYPVLRTLPQVKQRTGIIILRV